MKRPRRLGWAAADLSGAVRKCYNDISFKIAAEAFGVPA
jgi:hypothetical protein